MYHTPVKSQPKCVTAQQKLTQGTRPRERALLWCEGATDSPRGIEWASQQMGLWVINTENHGPGSQPQVELCRVMVGLLCPGSDTAESLNDVRRVSPLHWPLSVVTQNPGEL